MSVPNQIPYIIYNANGLTTVFPFEFYIISASDIQITMNGEVVTSGYTVSGVGNVGGGDVVFLTPPANGTVVMLERVVPTFRLTDYQDNGDLLADTVNKDFDRLWMAIQRSFLYLGLALRRPLLGGPYNAEGYRISEGADPVDKQDFATKNYVDNVSLIRALRVPESSVNPIPPAAERANRLLAFNYSGQPIVVLPESGSATDVLIELASTESGKGDNLLGVKQPVAGAADQTQHDKNAQVINLKDFGAKCDGVTDDTDALQSAMAAAQTGIRIVQPSGVCLTSQPLSFTKPIYWHAEAGARIKLTSGDHDYVVQIDLRGADKGHWGYGAYFGGERLIIDGGGHAKYGLSLRGVISSQFPNIRTTNITVAGLYQAWTQLCTYENYECSNNIEVFSTTPANGILAVKDINGLNDRGSSADIYINPCIEHVSGAGIAALALINSVFVNGTSEGNSIGIQLGHDTEDWAALGNTIIGMDLEENSATDILINSQSSMNDFIGLKAGYSSPSIQVKGYRNKFLGGSCSGFDFRPESHDNDVDGVTFIDVASTISNSGIRNTWRRVWNLKTAQVVNSTNPYPERKQITAAAGETVTINPMEASQFSILMTGSPINIGTLSSPRIDGIEFNITIFNTAGTDSPVINFDNSLRYAGWSNPKASKHRSMKFVYDAAFDYYTAVSVGQYDIDN
ncbi:phage tail fiber protein [Citrobacter sp. Cpo061]|uniref:phage tail fiber domain-containing protein n=1 Tax=Citrobacter TaxID=544 RepID=UPI00244AF2DC|nr:MULTISPECIES: phage tail fiber protein [Citrobacter]MDH1794652.1 phage tail fiber protein [Citrobacter portucalensis]MDM2868553.1 phage tail fiber protein [Citrobacter sp. Cpo061]